jgi:hypothetical protein
MVTSTGTLQRGDRPGRKPGFGTSSELHADFSSVVKKDRCWRLIDPANFEAQGSGPNQLALHRRQ